MCSHLPQQSHKTRALYTHFHTNAKPQMMFERLFALSSQTISLHQKKNDKHIEQKQQNYVEQNLFTHT